MLAHRRMPQNLFFGWRRSRAQDGGDSSRRTVEPGSWFLVPVLDQEPGTKHYEVLQCLSSRALRRRPPATCTLATLSTRSTCGIACAEEGRVLLRIQDHDRHRSRQEYESRILEDLAWLGFVADTGPVPFVRQSARSTLYESALDGLRRRGLVYACDCSRSEISVPPPARRGMVLTGSPELRTRDVRDKGSLSRLPWACDFGWSRPSSASSTVVMASRPSGHPDQCGDLLVRDRDGN